MDIKVENADSFKDFASYTRNSLLKYSELGHLRNQKFYQKLFAGDILKTIGENHLDLSEYELALQNLEMVFNFIKALSIFRFLIYKSSKIPKEGFRNLKKLI